MIRRVVALARATGGVEVLLRAGPVQRRQKRLVVYEDHVVALSVPVDVVSLTQFFDVEMASDVVTAARRLQDHVVAVARPILSAVVMLIAAALGVVESITWFLAIPKGVKPPRVVG